MLRRDALRWVVSVRPTAPCGAVRRRRCVFWGNIIPVIVTLSDYLGHAPEITGHEPDAATWLRVLRARAVLRHARAL